MISVTGELEAVSIKPFASALFAAAESGDPEIHLDMANVTAIDDACVECLVDAHREITAAGRRVQVVQASRVVVDALVAVGAWERFA